MVQQELMLTSTMDAFYVWRRLGLRSPRYRSSPDSPLNFWYRGTKAVDFRSIPGMAGDRKIANDPASGKRFTVANVIEFAAHRTKPDR